MEMGVYHIPSLSSALNGKISQFVWTSVYLPKVPRGKPRGTSTINKRRENTLLLSKLRTVYLSYSNFQV